MANNNSNFSHLPERLAGLGEIAENLWWSWQPAARQVFKMLNRQAWQESIHNPDKMLRMLPAADLKRAAADPDYLRHYDLVLSRYRQYVQEKGCSLLNTSCQDERPLIAYLSAEFGLHHSLPFYAGGLGFLAGDFIKECSDLNLPMIAVGFMYPQGYVRQRINNSGWQESMAQDMDREAASISRVLDPDGRQFTIQVPLVDPPIHVQVWRVMVGRVPLYLLDTDTDLNDPEHRKISSHLYIGDKELRLRQEIVLGVGGYEILEKMGAEPPISHLNEGHAAFSLLERIRDRVQSGRMTFDQAMEHIRSTTVFTTHTPVPAGHDIFPFDLIEKYFRHYWPSLGLDRQGFMALGMHPEQPDKGFNMTALAMRLTGRINGVSQRHAEVSRTMWQSLWPDRPPAAVPIIPITNGVHVPTWIEPRMGLLFDKYLGAGWLENHDDPLVWEMVEEIPDQELWELHCWLKIKLFDLIRERSRQRFTEEGNNSDLVVSGGPLLDPTVLTIGFARRFATYKRADLLLYDLERLTGLVNNRWQPLQIIFAGKAHPDDEAGKLILQRVFNAARNPRLAGRVAFVEDYGEQFAQYLVHGVDVWLNNPLPPMEACGTSGMKAAFNGVPNLSILDGWWLEGFTGDNGWAFSHREEGGDRDRADAETLYRLLADEIVPLYYRTEDHGIPRGWVRVMKKAIKGCAAGFSARRMVKEYVDGLYRPGLDYLGKHC